MGTEPVKPCSLACQTRFVDTNLLTNAKKLMDRMENNIHQQKITIIELSIKSLRDDALIKQLKQQIRDRDNIISANQAPTAPPETFMDRLRKRMNTMKFGFSKKSMSG